MIIQSGIGATQRHRDRTHNMRDQLSISPLWLQILISVYLYFLNRTRRSQNQLLLAALAQPAAGSRLVFDAPRRPSLNTLPAALRDLNNYLIPVPELLFSTFRISTVEMYYKGMEYVKSLNLRRGVSCLAVWSPVGPTLCCSSLTHDPNVWKLMNHSMQ